jgi:tetratricopeptide (TPR) repeat protein/uncharacterized caspase-like protein
MSAFLFVALLSIAFLAPLPAQQARDLQIERSTPVNPLGGKGTRWALVVGVSQHQHLPPQAQLRFAHRDAEAFAAFLRSREGGGLPASHIQLLTDGKATLAALRAALHTWLVQSAEPDDIVYVFFAGHGVVAERGEAFFVAHDSDPQNLHATGLTFAEVESTLSRQLRASLVVFAADACHAGQIGWTTFTPNTPGNSGPALEKLGQGDRSILKLLAARPSERSFEDERWDGGHGIFTYSLLEALRGRADRDGDRFVRASEAIDFVAQNVPAQTATQQNPRVAGTFDPRLTLAVLPAPPPPATLTRPVAPATLSLEIQGPPSTAIYIDRVFRGSLSASDRLRLEGLSPGEHSITAQFPTAQFPTAAPLEGTIRLSAADSQLTLRPPAVLSPWERQVAGGQFRQALATFAQQKLERDEKASAQARLEAAIEGQAQACVADYVQSTALGPKAPLLERAVAAFEALKTLRPGDPAIETRRLFCQGRLDIATNRFDAAVNNLRAALARDSNFACAHNALGVAYGRLGKVKEARQAFDNAALLTPEWALPPFQIASVLIAAGKVKDALPYLESAVKYNPNSSGTRWSLTRAYRALNRPKEALQAAQDLIRLDPNYAPGYLEIARILDLSGNSAASVAAYEAYLQLAPNFGDSDQVRIRAQELRSSLPREKR